MPDDPSPSQPQSQPPSQPHQSPPPLPPKSPPPLPMPVRPLAYAAPGTVRTGRTWLITVTGIACLAVAGLAGVLGWYTKYGAHDLHASALPPPNASPPPPPVPAAGLKPHDGDVIGERGLHRAARAAFVAAVVARAPTLNPDRRVVLDWLLREIGADALARPPGTTGAAAADVGAKILDVSQKPDGPDGKRGLGTHVIRTVGGTIELNNARATFTAAADGRVAQLLWHAFTDYAGRRMWSSASIERAMETAQANAIARTPSSPLPTYPGAKHPGPVNAMQASALVTELRKHAPSTAPYEAAKPLELATFHRLAGDTVEVYIDNQTVWLLAGGAVVRPNPQQIYDWDPATGMKAWKPPPMQSWLPVSRRATGYLVADVYIGLVMAVVLAVLGICLLFDVRRSRRLLLVYGVARILFGTAAAVAALVIVGELSDAARGARQAGGAPVMTVRANGLALQTAILWVVQAGLAVALILVLFTPAVRNHFASLGEPSLLPATLRQAVARFARGRGAVWALRAVAAIAALAVGAYVVLIVMELLGAGGPRGLGSGTGVGPVIVSAGRVAGHVFGGCIAASVVVVGRRLLRRMAGPPPAVPPPRVAAALLVALTCVGAGGAAAQEKRRTEQTIDELVQGVRDAVQQTPKPDQLYRAFDPLPHSPRGTAAAMRLVRDPDPQISRAATKWLCGRASRLGGRGVPTVADDVLAERAETVPVLIARTLEHSAGRGQEPTDAMEALQRIGVEAAECELLVKALDTSRDDNVVSRAMQVLYDVKPAPPGAVQAFRKLMRSPEDHIASRATQWLSRVHRQPADVLDAARDTDPRARARAIHTLYELVHNKVIQREQVMPLLLEAKDHDHERVREAAIDALARIMPVEQRQAMLLRQFREARDERERENVLRHLHAYTTAKPPELTAQFEAMLDEGDAKLRVAAIKAFGESWARDHVPYDKLYALVADDRADFDVARAAGTRLKSLSWDLLRAGPVTRPRLDSIASVSGPGGTTQRFVRDPEPVVPPQTYPPASVAPGPSVASSESAEPDVPFVQRLASITRVTTVVAAVALGIVLLARLVSRPAGADARPA